MNNLGLNVTGHWRTVYYWRGTLRMSAIKVALCEDSITPSTYGIEFKRRLNLGLGLGLDLNSSVDVSGC